MEEQAHRPHVVRKADRWFGPLTQLWDWIDARDIDKHVVSIAIMWGTVKVTAWAILYATTSTKTGIEIAAVIASVLVPYNALQAAAIKWYFNARTE